jgi:hypothetical protein
MSVIKKALICIFCGIFIASCSGKALAYMPAPSDDQVMEDPGSDDAVLEDPGSGGSHSGGSGNSGSGSHSGGSGHSGSNPGENSGRNGGGNGGGSGSGSQSKKDETKPKKPSVEDKQKDEKDSGEDEADTDEKKDTKEADESDNEPIDDKETPEREDLLTGPEGTDSDVQDDLMQNEQEEEHGEPYQEDIEREPAQEPKAPNGTKAVSIASIMPRLKIAGVVLLLAVVVALVFFAIKKRREMPRRPKASPKEKHSEDEEHEPVEARDRPIKKAKAESSKVNYEMFRRIDLAPLLSAKAGEVAVLSDESSELIGMGVKLFERGDLYDAFKVFYDAMANRSGLTLGEICDVTLANKKMIVLLDEEITSFTPEGKEKLKELLSDSIKKSENLLQMLKVQEESADPNEKVVINETRTKTMAILERYKKELDEDGQGCEGAGEGE